MKLAVSGVATSSRSAHCAARAQSELRDQRAPVVSILKWVSISDLFFIMRDDESFVFAAQRKV